MTSELVDKYLLPVLTALVGLALLLTGEFTGNALLSQLGLVALGSALGLPLNGIWSQKDYLVK
jgi:hypothetical protein